MGWRRVGAVFSGDLQVIMLPVMPGLKKAIFCRRIVIFNESGGIKKCKSTGVLVLWHEGISG